MISELPFETDIIRDSNIVKFLSDARPEVTGFATQKKLSFLVHRQTTFSLYLLYQPDSTDDDFGLC